MFWSNPPALQYSMERDLKLENERQKRIITGNVIENLLYLPAITKLIPPQLQQPVSNLLGLSYEGYILDLYIEDIHSILNLKSDADGRIQELIERNDSKANDQLLVAFFMLVGSNSIEPIMELAKQRADASDRDSSKSKSFL